MEIDKAIRIFSFFLNNTWEIITPLLVERTYTTDESSKSDWLQSNWEILVERKVLQLNEYLEVYGNGADFNGVSCRITDIESFATHTVKIAICKGKDMLNGMEIQGAEYFFEQLVGFRDGFYTDSTPFNFVLVRDENMDIERVFSLEDVVFELEKI